jgi:protein gp37
MGKNSGIEWTIDTYNPTVGCRKISEGCNNCYAEKQHKRLQNMGLEKYNRPFEVVRLYEPHLDIPSRTKKPTVFFVNSMSDLFHSDLKESDLLKVFKEMNSNPQHIFQILTKRPLNIIGHNLNWTDNIWLGVTIESAKYLHRAETLQKIPARHKFISFEPLLDRIELTLENLEGIDWVIVGGESGQKARPLSRKGAIDIFLRSQSIGVPFFFKQQGSNKYPPAQLNDYYNGKLISEYKQFPSEIQKLMEGKKKK